MRLARRRSAARRWVCQESGEQECDTGGNRWRKPCHRCVLSPCPALTNGEQLRFACFRRLRSLVLRHAVVPHAEHRAIGHVASGAWRGSFVVNIEPNFRLLGTGPRRPELNAEGFAFWLIPR